MNADLVPTQFDALEEPKSDEETIAIDIAHPPHAILNEIRQKLAL